jgi:hypothetical protein
MSDRLAFNALASRQHSVVSVSQALDLGFTHSAIERRVTRGEWDRLSRGVFRVAAAPFTWHTRVMAACLAARGVASHRTGAVLHGLDGVRPGQPELIIPRGRSCRVGGARIHEVRDFDLRAETSRAGIPVCGVGTILFQLAGVYGWEFAGALMDDAVRQRLVGWEDLYQVLVLHARRGRKGSALFRDLLDARWGNRVPDSRWNRQAADLLVDDGLPAPVLEHEVLGPDGGLIARVDLAWPPVKLGVELQSLRFHFGEAAFERDPARRNALIAAGWTVPEYTWRSFVEHPKRFCDQIRATLALLGHPAVTNRRQ